MKRHKIQKVTDLRIYISIIIFKIVSDSRLNLNLHSFTIDREFSLSSVTSAILQGFYAITVRLKLCDKSNQIWCIYTTATIILMKALFLPFVSLHLQ